MDFNDASFSCLIKVMWWNQILVNCIFSIWRVPFVLCATWRLKLDLQQVKTVTYCHLYICTPCYLKQAFHPFANLWKTAFLALAENSASVNFLHGRIPENPRSHPIELPSLVQDSPVAIYQGCQDFRNSALGPNWVKFRCLVWVLVLSPRSWRKLKAPSRNQFMRNSDRRKQSGRLLEWPEICAC